MSAVIKVQRANKIGLIYALEAAIPDLKIEKLEYRMISDPPCPILIIRSNDPRVKRALKAYSQAQMKSDFDRKQEVYDPNFKPSLDALNDAARKG